MTKRKAPELSDLDELRALTREAHEVMKDLQSLLKDAKTVRDEVEQAVTVATIQAIGPFLDEHMATLKQNLSELNDGLETRITERFDTLWGFMFTDKDVDASVVLRALESHPDKVVPKLLHTIEEHGGKIEIGTEQEVPSWRPEG